MNLKELNKVIDTLKSIEPIINNKLELISIGDDDFNEIESITSIGVTKTFGDRFIVYKGVWLLNEKNTGLQKGCLCPMYSKQ